MYGGKAPTKRCKVIPHFDLPDIIKCKRIVYPDIYELNYKEIFRAMNYGEVYEILPDGSDIYLDFKNYRNDNTSEMKFGMDDPLVKGLHGVTTSQTNAVGKAGLDRARIYR